MFVPRHLRQPKKVAEEPESVNKPRDGVPTEDSIQALTKMVKDLQIRDKGKKVYTRQDFYLGLDGDSNLEDLPRKFIKFDGSDNPKAHLAMFFAECARFSEDNRALFLCFPRSLEGIAAKYHTQSTSTPLSCEILTKLLICLWNDSCSILRHCPPSIICTI